MENSDIPKGLLLEDLSMDDRLVVYDMSKQPNGVRAITVGELFHQFFNSLPEEDPGIAGEPWLNSGVVSVSSGE